MLQTRSLSFELDQFIADCRTALTQDRSPKAVREVVARAVCEPAAVLKAIGDPKRAEIQKLYCSTELTVLNVIWAPRMAIAPHDHRMWAVIGIYAGCEENMFWRRIQDERGGKIEAAGAKTLVKKEALPLGRDIIHSVTNPVSGFTGALHVYGGDFFGTERSEWHPETLLEQRYSVEKTLRLFEEANVGYTGN